MCVSVSVYVCSCMGEEDVHEKRKRKERIKKQERRENINLFIQINTQTDEQTDRQTKRRKSFIDMRYNTEQYSKSNSIE